MNLELVASKFTPDFVIDVGAHVGHWIGDAKAFWPNAEYFAIEGNEECREALANLGVKFRIAVLSDTQKEVTFYTLKDCPCATGSSYYLENTSIFAGDNAIPHAVTTSTLDEVLEGIPLEDCKVLLKIDAQGCELDILHGAQKTLKNVQAAVLEVAYTNYNIGAPKANDVARFMHEQGFTAEEIVGHHNHPLEGHHIQSDVLFLKP